MSIDSARSSGVGGRRANSLRHSRRKGMTHTCLKTGTPARLETPASLDALAPFDLSTQLDALAPHAESRAEFPDESRVKSLDESRAKSAEGIGEREK